MNDISIRLIGRENAADIRLPNERFPLFGRMLPSYSNGKWSYTVTELTEPGWDIFPDENYNFEEMQKNYVFIGAYDAEKCIGLAILERQWSKYLYLYDLKVNSDYRDRHIGTRLIEKACECAGELGKRGVWTVGQDNNLAACLFYIHNGFRIGGLDTEVYNGTKQEGKADIYFYKDL